MLKIGDKAPDFTLNSDEGKEVSLSDFKGKSVFIFFFPKANTSG
jgi:thioredoxin-dependent peroxiredoxin